MIKSLSALFLLCLLGICVIGWSHEYRLCAEAEYRLTEISHRVEHISVMLNTPNYGLVTVSECNIGVLPRKDKAQ